MHTSRHALKLIFSLLACAGFSFTGSATAAEKPAGPYQQQGYVYSEKRVNDPAATPATLRVDMAAVREYWDFRVSEDRAAKAAVASENWEAMTARNNTDADARKASRIHDRADVAAAASQHVNARFAWLKQKAMQGDADAAYRYAWLLSRYDPDRNAFALRASRAGHLGATALLANQFLGAFETAPDFVSEKDRGAKRSISKNATNNAANPYINQAVDLFEAASAFNDAWPMSFVASVRDVGYNELAFDYIEKDRKRARLLKERLLLSPAPDAIAAFNAVSDTGEENPMTVFPRRQLRAELSPMVWETRRAANAGDVEAQYRLGLFGAQGYVQTGLDPVADAPLALSMGLNSAATDPFFSSDREGALRDNTLADVSKLPYRMSSAEQIFWLGKAAASGHAGARYVLGRLHFLEGRPKEALPLLKAAVDAGQVPAMYYLARLTTDPSQKQLLIEQGARAGDPRALAAFAETLAIGIDGRVIPGGAGFDAVETARKAGAPGAWLAARVAEAAGDQAGALAFYREALPNANAWTLDGVAARNDFHADYLRSLMRNHDLKSAKLLLSSWVVDRGVQNDFRWEFVEKLNRNYPFEFLWTAVVDTLANNDFETKSYDQRMVMMAFGKKNNVRHAQEMQKMLEDVEDACAPPVCAVDLAFSAAYFGSQPASLAYARRLAADGQKKDSVKWYNQCAAQQGPLTELCIREGGGAKAGQNTQQIAASGGDQPSLELLYRCHAPGITAREKNCKPDGDAALGYIKQLALLDAVWAEQAYRALIGENAELPVNPPRHAEADKLALESWEKIKGVPDAAGIALILGRAVPRDVVRGEALCTSSFCEGLALFAQGHLGTARMAFANPSQSDAFLWQAVMYEQGYGVEQNLPLAARLKDQARINFGAAEGYESNSSLNRRWEEAQKLAKELRAAP